MRMGTRWYAIGKDDKKVTRNQLDSQPEMNATPNTRILSLVSLTLANVVANSLAD